MAAEFSFPDFGISGAALLRVDGQEHQDARVP
jgi:hypothetical protein